MQYCMYKSVGILTGVCNYACKDSCMQAAAGKMKQLFCFFVFFPENQESLEVLTFLICEECCFACAGEGVCNFGV